MSDHSTPAMIPRPTLDDVVPSPSNNQPPNIHWFPPPTGQPVSSPPPKPRRKWPFVVVAVLAILGIGAGTWAILDNRSNTDDASADPASPQTTEPDKVIAPPETTILSESPTVSANSQPANASSPPTQPSASNPDSRAGIHVSEGHESIDVHRTDLDVAAVVNTVKPSVVTVSADVQSDFGIGGSIGTGVIITEDGNILTNAHVVEDSTTVRVRLNGESEPVPAEVLASDPGNDLALLDIAGEDHKPAVFAQPGEAALGDGVVAIGFALDLDGEPSVTLGIVSAVNRTLELDANTALDGLIQTDAAISSGNSGGPLVNAAGEVVGLNTAVARGDSNTAATNVGFAISVDEILQVVPELRDAANGVTREDGFLGVNLEYRLDGGQGALVSAVEDGTPAAEAGIKAGDVVLSVDGAPVNGAAGLIAAIRDREPGDEVHITVLRDGAEQELTAVLTTRPTTTDG